jgi:predicted transcriptional regulator
MRKRYISAKLVPQVSERYAYILLITPKWWNRLCDRLEAGKTFHAFIRRGLVGPKKTNLLLFYVTRPFKEIRGFAEFVERVTGEADDLWRAYSGETSPRSYEEYKDFLQGRLKTTFIRFKSLKMFSQPISASVISQVVGIGRMPRGGRYISREIAQELV